MIIAVRRGTMGRKRYRESDPVARERCDELRRALEGYVSVDDAAEALQMHPITFRGRIVRGEVSTVRTPAGAIIVARSEVERLQRLLAVDAVGRAS